MAKNLSLGVLTALVIVALLLGGVVGHYVAPNEVEVTKNQTVEVPVEVIKVVNQTVEVEAPSALDNAVETFLKAAEDEEDEAGNTVDVLNNYDFDQIVVSKISKNWNVAYTKDTTVVEFTITLKYDEKGDSERSEKETYDVTVTYENGEDTIVEVA